ncbi:MAG: DUF3037 domain-containing protein [Acidobacteria bacterium]|nr:DUF3037 domain-containing protein [Acidobacteriota bacterium]
MNYKYQLLRYMPNRLSGEAYNLAVLLYDGGGGLVDARFTPDFVRLRSNPLADLAYLHTLRQEFEDRRLAGEGFSHYVEELGRDLSQALQLSEEKFFLGGEALEEVEQLAKIYLATPRRAELGRPAESRPGTRRWVLGRMRETFELYHLAGRLEPEVAVGGFVSPRFSFHVDYAYKPNGTTNYLHALSLEHDVADAGRLCFVFDRIRAQAPAAMTAVVADGIPEDTRTLLASSQIQAWPVSKLDELALQVREQLGL